MQKITPHLWFDKNAEEAVDFYTSVFRGGKIISLARYPEAGQEVSGMPAGSVMNIEFEIEGYKMLGLNGGPIFKFNPSISFMIGCSTVAEVDELWGKLSDGGQVLMPLQEYPFSKRYGWIQDKFGLSWQIIFSEKGGRQIVPSLMFTKDNVGKCEEAINYYTSIFPDSKVGDLARYPAGMEPDKEGHIMYGEFYLFGQKFSAMESAREHNFSFNEAISLLVTCMDQKEIDQYWEKLSALPEAEQCGWLKDKYGVSWQIVPAGMDKIFNLPDKENVNKMMSAFLKMKKIDMGKLKEVLEG